MTFKSSVGELRPKIAQTPISTPNWVEIALINAAKFWYVVTATGQWLFVAFIVLFYYGPTLSGNFSEWSRNKQLPHGYVAGDTAGNLMFALHVLLAGVMTVAGTLQLLPHLRARWPMAHRWSGRVFMFLALGLALSGLLMVWWGQRATSLPSAISISLNAMLIIAFAAQAWRNAVARQIAAHRRWALRLFMAASGVWFMRLGYMAWILINQAPVGIEDGQTGWFDRFWAPGSYLLPLAVLELYFFAQASDNPRVKASVAILVGVLTLLMVVGIGGAYMFMWRKLM